MKTETMDYWVADAFACYIAYGDTDTLTDAEVSEFNELEIEARGFFARDGLKFIHWHVSDDVDDFRKCEATGLHARCVKITAVYRG